MCRIRAVFFSVLMLFGGWYTTALAQSDLVIATRENALTNRFAEQVLSIAYERIGYKVRFERYPDARSVIQADKGYTDGEAARLSAVLKQYSNLRAVPVPLFYSELSAFVRTNRTFKVTDWDSLGQYSLSTIRGFKFVQNKLKEFSPHTFETSEDVIKRVEMGRIDVGVLNRFLGQLAVKKVGATHVKDITPPLERLPVFHLVHQKNEHLIPKLTAVLRNMHDSGELQALWNTFVQDTLAQIKP